MAARPLWLWAPHDPRGTRGEGLLPKLWNPMPSEENCATGTRPAIRTRARGAARWPRPISDVSTPAAVPSPACACPAENLRGAGCTVAPPRSGTGSTAGIPPRWSARAPRSPSCWPRRPRCSIGWPSCRPAYTTWTACPTANETCGFLPQKTRQPAGGLIPPQPPDVFRLPQQDLERKKNHARVRTGCGLGSRLAARAATRRGSKDGGRVYTE